MDKRSQVGIYVLLEERVPDALKTGPNDVYLTISRHHICSVDEVLPVRLEVSPSKPYTKRYNFALTRSTYEAIQKIAQKHKMTVSEVMRLYTQLMTAPSNVAEEYKATQTLEYIRVLAEIEALAKK